MHLIAAGWLYVTAMMALVEALAPNGTVLGALFTFVLYGALPLVLLLYLSARTRRRRAPRHAHAHAHAQDGTTSTTDPDRGGHATGDTVAPVREES
jgi:Na+/melibiose symporter-like transporter